MQKNTKRRAFPSHLPNILHGQQKRPDKYENMRSKSYQSLAHIITTKTKTASIKHQLRKSPGGQKDNDQKSQQKLRLQASRNSPSGQNNNDQLVQLECRHKRKAQRNQPEALSYNATIKTSNLPKNIHASPRKREKQTEVPKIAPDSNTAIPINCASVTPNPV